MAVEAVKRKGKAKESVIESKDQRWHCRNRVTLVFGSNDVEELETYTYEDDKILFKTVDFHQAKSKAIEEILDNCIDEFYRGYVTQIHTTLSSDGMTITVEDNGIGFPLKNIAQVYSEFRTGSKFKDEEIDKKGFLSRTLGQNGLGAAATCLTSDIFKVRVRHYNSKKEQTYTFLDGALKIKKTKPKPFKGHSGVQVEVTLAKEVYKNSKIDCDLLRKRIIDLAYNNPGLTFYFNKEKFVYKKGMIELAERIGGKNARIIGDEAIIYETQTSKKKKAKGKIDIHVSVVLNNQSEEREKFITFVNSTPTFDGGYHQDRVKRLFINSLKEKLERKAKKAKVSIVDNDILAGLTFLISITMPNPRFESQTKRKLVRDTQLDKAIEKFFEKNIEKFLKKNGEFLESILDRAQSRQKFQELKDASKAGRKQKRKRVEKLLDANERKKRNLCTLFICEGDSAIGGLRSARNKLYQGGIALRGKPMNVTQSSIKDVLNNQEFLDIMASVGLTLGQEVVFEKLRYSQIVFLADSDVDGGHINTLLANFFYSYWPELFHNGSIQIAKAPLFEVITDKGTIYLESDKELEDLNSKNTVKIKQIHRNKGLGEMSPEAWKYILNREVYTKIIISTTENAKSILNVCFGKDTSLRKQLLLDDDSFLSPKEIVKDKKTIDKKQITKKVSKKITKTTNKTTKKITKKGTKKTIKKIAKKVAKKNIKKKISKKR